MLTLPSVQGSHELVREYGSGRDGDSHHQVTAETVVQGTEEAVAITIKLVTDPTTGNRRFTIE